jgi:N-acetylmuramoyl-L-alanine amidase
MRQINRAFIHCSYTPPSMDIGVVEMRRWHTSPDPNDPSKPWADIGYHYIIRRNGLRELGRPLERQGAHVGGHNSDSIGICLVGGKAETDLSPECNFTADQWSELQALVEELLIRFPNISILGHRDQAPGRACPTFNAGAWASSVILK